MDQVPVFVAKHRSEEPRQLDFGHSKLLVENGLSDHSFPDSAGPEVLVLGEED